MAVGTVVTGVYAGVATFADPADKTTAEASGPVLRSTPLAAVLAQDYRTTAQKDRLPQQAEQHEVGMRWAAEREEQRQHEAEEEARRQAEEEARQAEEEAKAAEEARQAEEARRQADEEARRQAEEDAEAERQESATQESRTADRSSSDPKTAARTMMADYGWGDDQFSCLDNLWERESNWNHLAENPSSGAYGIPQSLPADKMASAGDDWRTNPITQITWGLGYINERYGSPCAAWSHSESVGWY